MRIESLGDCLYGTHLIYEEWNGLSIGLTFLDEMPSVALVRTFPTESPKGNFRRSSCWMDEADMGRAIAIARQY